jgi:hypothetical protein
MVISVQRNGLDDPPSGPIVVWQCAGRLHILRDEIGLSGSAILARIEKFDGNLSAISNAQ